MCQQPAGLACAYTCVFTNESALLSFPQSGALEVILLQHILAVATSSGTSPTQVQFFLRKKAWLLSAILGVFFLCFSRSGWLYWGYIGGYGYIYIYICRGNIGIMKKKLETGFSLTMLTNLPRRTTSWKHPSLQRGPRKVELFASYCLSLFGLGCAGSRVRLEHQCYYGLGMDALLTVCTWNTNVMMVLATECSENVAVCWGLGCGDNQMQIEQGYYHGVGMDAPITGWSWSMDVVMAFARMLWHPSGVGART